MPELPDINAYCASIEDRVRGKQLEYVTILKPFFLRSADPPLTAVARRKVLNVQRLGKRVVIGLSSQHYLVIHLMIAGRFQWFQTGAPPRKANRNTLAQLQFSTGTLSITEAGTKRRASLYLVQGKEQLELHDPGGLEVMTCDLTAFATRIQRENRTLKRALTDPRILSGIGNAYSDEILHAAGLSPVKLTSRLDHLETERLFAATVATLEHWSALLNAEAKREFPKKVTAFRPEMAAHGRYRLPCPKCGSLIQRIRYANNETNYCPTCQTDGKLLADRALSRLLKKDWPKTADELEQLRPRES